MTKKTVFITPQQFCETDDKPLKELEGAGFAIRKNTLGRRLRPEEMGELLKDADAVIAAVEPYDARLLESLPRLKCISRCGSGTDSVDLAAARRIGITVKATPDETVEPVAQMTVAMILALARNLYTHQKDFAQGLWAKRYGHLLSEWTVGIIGYGRIGMKVWSYLRHFGTKVMLYADPMVKVESPEIGGSSLDELLQRSDCVTLHAARGPEQGAIIGAYQLKLMKKGSVLVNTSRGHLVDESALYQVLKSGHLAGAALDVFEKEPYQGPLSKLSNVFCTPHVSTLTRASRAAMELRSAINVIEYFRNREFEHVGR